MSDYQKEAEATSQYLNRPPRSLAEAKMDALDRAIRDLRAAIRWRANQEGRPMADYQTETETETGKVEQTMTYVPGPYTAIPPLEDDNDTEHWEIHDGFGRTATVYGDPDKETAATAQLLASAPDLLAALEHLAQWAEAPDLDPVNPFDDGYNAGRMYAAEHARAAIAKAKGV